jgi:hypothetical protein
MRGRLTRAGPQHDRTRIGDAHLGMLLFRNSNTSNSQIFTPVSGNYTPTCTAAFLRGIRLHRGRVHRGMRVG